MLMDILAKVERGRLHELERAFKNVLDAEKLDQAGVTELINTLTTRGIDFWAEINRPTVNTRDLRYRDTYRTFERRYYEARSPKERVRWRNYAEPYFEFRLLARYPISAREYLFSQSVMLPNGKRVYIVPLEISYLIFSEFYPHYLGPREKYQEAASILEASGGLNPENLRLFREVLEEREERYELVGEFEFEIGSDKTLDPLWLQRISENGKRALRVREPNYLALLLEGVHYQLAP